MRSVFCLAFAASVFAAPRAVAQTDSRGAPAVQESAADVIRPGDVVRLRIWREPDLSGDFQIDESGEVVLPRIGPLKATSETPQSLKQKLVAEYQRYLAQTSIDVTVLRRIQVLGAVRNPGLYPLDATMTVSDAIAMAGGVAPEGNEKNVQLIRGGEKISGKISQRTRLADTPIRSGDQLYIPERSWLARNGYFAGSLIAATATMIAILSRR